ncbi:MAG: DUF202 domain-containing protein [Pseudomonadota bacterium]
MNESKDTEDDLAQQRTNWAEDRTLLANERTFSGWMGSGLGAVGVAIGLKAVFGDFEPTWAAKAVASMFLGIAIYIYWAACTSAAKARKRLKSSDAEVQSGKSFSLLASFMTIATICVGAVLWSL